MSEKIQWVKEWKFYEGRSKKYYGITLNREWIVELVEEEKVKVVLSKTGYIPITTKGIYPLESRGYLIEAHVIPGILLQFTVADCIYVKNITHVSFEKVDLERYLYTCKSKDYTEISGENSSSTRYLEASLSKEGISEYLKEVAPTFEAYPFFTLPFGNCFF